MKKFIIVIIAMVTITTIGLVGLTAMSPDVEHVKITSYGPSTTEEPVTKEYYIVNGNEMFVEEYQSWMKDQSIFGRR